jgi:hypothetical protein
MCQREQNNGIMVFLFIIFIFSTQMVESIPDIIVEKPFYLRARIHDSHSASVLFEIAKDNDQRKCQMYKFTIRRNREQPHPMPEQNLTFWRNTLELKHLAAGHYKVCATICSENLRQENYHYQQYIKNNHTIPITTCVDFHIFRSHLLFFASYILVLIFLIISQIIFSLRKRQFNARVKVALIELESSVQKWRAQHPQLVSTDRTQSYCILQSLLTLPASPPVELHHDEQHPHPPIFHLEIPNEE